MKFPLIGLAAAVLLSSPLFAAPSFTQSVLNDAKTLKCTLILEDTRLSYTVSRIGEDGVELPVLERSPMGIRREDTDFGSGLEYVSSSAPEVLSGRYALSAGKCREASYTAVQQRFLFRNAQRQEISVTIRAQSDGVAFRYGFPSGPAGELKIVDESTGFKLPREGRVWLQPYEKVAECAPSYESEYQNGIPIGTRAPGGSYAGWALPALFQTKSGWALVTEAGLDGSCYAAHLQENCEEGLYRVRLPEEAETYGVAPQYAVATAPWQSPWRVIISGPTLATIVETTFVTDLNPPSVIKDCSWIKPGLASWSWWSDTSSPSDYNRLVPSIDLSSDLHWPYSTVDLGWHQMRNGNIEQLLAYAKSKNVGLFLWYNSGGLHNQLRTCGPVDRFNTPELCEKEMSWLEKIGAKGVKVDFFQSDKQYVIKQYLNILEAAARHHILVDFHGATIPRGWARTYPNLLTSEGVRGTEQFWDERMAEQAHTLGTIYTFTRNVIGSMDYTPVVIGGAAHLQWPKTTNAYELATVVAFESGVQHVCANVAALRAQPDYVQALLAQVPAAWDETRYVDGMPGELSVLARRKGAEWYVSALNGRNEAKTVRVSLRFLGETEYAGDLIGDGKWQKDYSHRIVTVKKADVLTLELAGRGGAVMRLTPAK